MKKHLISLVALSAMMLVGCGENAESSTSLPASSVTESTPADSSLVSSVADSSKDSTIPDSSKVHLKKILLLKILVSIQLLMSLTSP